MTNINEETGLPDLPEGYFWRVKKSLGEFLKVQVRKKTWFGSKVRAENMMYLSEATEYKVKSYAVMTFREFQNLESKRYKGFIGDYPPKRLELM